MLSTPCVFEVCGKYHLLCLEENVRTRFLYISHYKWSLSNKLINIHQIKSIATLVRRHFELIQLRLRHVWQADCTHRTVGTSCTSYGNFENASDLLLQVTIWLFVSIF